MSGGFLGRWSQRKLTRKQEEEARRQAGESPEEATGEAVEPGCDTPPQENLQENSAAVQNEEELSEEELAALPPIDSITRETDLRQFMRKGVPAALKSAALRKMWLADPAIRNHVDYAVDYAWDWNTPGGVPGNAGQLLGESVAKMRDSILPKPVSDRNQPESQDQVSGGSMPEGAAMPQEEEEATQPEGEKVSAPEAMHARSPMTTGSDSDIAHGNAGEGDTKSRASPSAVKKSDSMSREGGDVPFRQKRHGSAIPT